MKIKVGMSLLLVVLALMPCVPGYSCSDTVPAEYYDYDWCDWCSGYCQPQLGGHYFWWCISMPNYDCVFAGNIWIQCDLENLYCGMCFGQTAYMYGGPCS